MPRPLPRGMGPRRFKRPGPAARTRWRPWEDDRLRAWHAAGVTYREVARRLSRTPKGVECRAALLGLPRREKGGSRG